MLVEQSFAVVLGNGDGSPWAPIIAAMIVMETCAWFPPGTSRCLPVTGPPDRPTTRPQCDQTIPIIVRLVCGSRYEGRGCRLRVVSGHVCADVSRRRKPRG